MMGGSVWLVGSRHGGVETSAGYFSGPAAAGEWIATKRREEAVEHMALRALRETNEMARLLAGLSVAPTEWYIVELSPSRVTDGH